MKHEKKVYILKLSGGIEFFFDNVEVLDDFILQMTPEMYSRLLTDPYTNQILVDDRKVIKVSEDVSLALSEL